MRRWHQEVPLLEKRKKLSWKLKPELGMFRKIRPLACPCSRKRGTGGCKIHKNFGNRPDARKFRDLKKFLNAQYDILELELDREKPTIRLDD